MKKYMKAEGVELLKEFNISHFVTTVNNRCERIICSECLKVSEDTVCDDGCTYEEGKIKVSKYISTGSNDVFRDTKNIHVEEISYVMSVFYWELDCIVNQDDGTLKFVKRPIVLLKIKDGKSEVAYGGQFNGVSLKSIKEAIEKAGIECEDLIENIEKANELGYDDYNNFSKYCNLVSNGHTLFADMEFIKTHKKLIKHVINRHYTSYHINSDKGISDVFEVPMCLVSHMCDDYFDFLVGYHDIRALDNHPTEIKGCIAYYVSVGKFKKSTIKQYLNVFEPDDFDTKTKILCFINFVKKNLWMGDSVFDYAKKAFQNAADNGIEINEDTINSKFMFGMKNMNLLYEKFGHSISDAFVHIKDTQGIVPAMKNLLEWLNEEKQETAK